MFCANEHCPRRIPTASIFTPTFRLIDPAMEFGLDFEAEYQATLERQKG